MALIGSMSSLVTVDHWSLLRVCLYTAGSLVLAAGVRVLVLGTQVHYVVFTALVIVNGIGGVLPGSEPQRMIRIVLLVGILVLLWEPPERLTKWRDGFRARLKGWRIPGVMGTTHESIYLGDLASEW
jgi:hypothetical protein